MPAQLISKKTGPDSQRVSISVRVLAGSRAGDQIVSVGIPLPSGIAAKKATWQCVSDSGHVHDVQTKCLAQWPDKSVKWLLVVLPVAWIGKDEQVQLRISDPTLPKRSTAHGNSYPGNENALKISELPGQQITVSTGVCDFRVTPGQTVFEQVEGAATCWLAPGGVRLVLTDARGVTHVGHIETLHVTESGPWRAQLEITGSLGRRTGLRFAGSLNFYAGSGLVRCRLTTQNPRRARHQGGYWDLGDPGSILIKDLSLQVDTTASPSRTIQWIDRTGAAAQNSTHPDLEIYQESSGGENWNSRNHVNRCGEVPLRFRGYRVRVAGRETSGDRANPVATLCWDGRHVGVALERFWQQFPSAIEVDRTRILVRLWPGQFSDLHELQAGEHNTRVVWLDFGHGRENPCQRLGWVHDPAVLGVDPEWGAASGAIPFLPSPETPRRQELVTILDKALEGERSFFAKRETIDEYGWRNFGDMWADHEEAYCEDPKPVVSHYNNQYDPLYGLLIQFVRTGDRRWWELADPLARHIMDIDIYHTDRDKPAYNGGLFWHTAHYHDAATCTHRTHSAKMAGKSGPGGGGGPANEHNYSAGLLLYYHLTGCERARQTVLGLADWVIAMDDGRGHVLSVLSDRPTGAASRTTEADFHRPGRGAGNSINVLLDGWQTSGQQRYLDKAVELIRRTIHPHDDIDAYDLGNAEMRWSYTVYLQALVRFLDVTGHRGDLSSVHAYVLASLLHYARWMVANERFYLDEPDKLEYPTETWAAQELRKGTTLWMAAQCVTGAEAEEFWQRGQEILDRAWTSLMSFPSHTCTRPMALVLQQGYLETYLKEHRQVIDQKTEIPKDPNTQIPNRDAGRQGATDVERDFGIPTRFVYQKQEVRQMVSSPIKAVQAFNYAVRPARWYNALRQTWTWQRCSEIVKGVGNW